MAAAPALADVLVHRQSPVGVYARNYEYVEQVLASISPQRLGSMFDKYDALASTKTYRILVETAGTRTIGGGMASAAWKAFVDDLAKHPKSNRAIDPAQYVGINARQLLSLFAFVQHSDDWRKGGIAYAAKLPAPDDDANAALGLTLDTSHVQPLTLDRLDRCFTDSFLISEPVLGPTRDRFAQILVRVGSAFMENMILSRKTREEPLKHFGVATCGPEENSVVYMMLPFSDVIHDVDRVIQDVDKVYTESGDDVY